MKGGLVQSLLYPVYYVWRTGGGYKVFKLESTFRDEDNNNFYSGLLLKVWHNGYRWYIQSYSEEYWNNVDKKRIKESDFKRVLDKCYNFQDKLWETIESIEK